MPASIRAHVRYPEDIFAIQSQVYATYHMTQPAVFYNREDQWEIPTVDDGNERSAMQPYYTIMRLPGEKERGVHPDAAVHAAATRQPGRVARRAQRRRALRHDASPSSSRSRSWCSALGRSSRASRRTRSSRRRSRCGISKARR